MKRKGEINMKKYKTDARKKQELEQKRAAEITKPTSIRLSNQERAIISEKAAAKGMKMTTYIVDAAVHGSDGITPKDMVQIQNVVMKAVELANEVNPAAAQNLKSEVNDLWQRLF